MQNSALNNEQLYIEYSGKVKAYVRGKISNMWEAEDLVSEIFVKIYSKIESFDCSKASLSTWIYTITRNTVIDYFRARKIVCELPENFEYVDSYAQDMMKEDSLESLADALENLDERLREIVILHYFKEFSLKKIAELMEMSYANVKLLHKKALMQMKNLI